LKKRPCEKKYHREAHNNSNFKETDSVKRGGNKRINGGGNEEAKHVLGSKRIWEKTGITEKNSKGDHWGANL